MPNVFENVINWSKKIRSKKGNTPTPVPNIEDTIKQSDTVQNVKIFENHFSEHFEPPKSSTDSPINENSSYFDYLINSFWQFVDDYIPDYFNDYIPDYWRTGKNEADQNILNFQKEEKEKLENFERIKSNRNSRISKQYNEDIGFLNTKQQIVKNWNENSKKYLKIQRDSAQSQSMSYDRTTGIFDDSIEKTDRGAYLQQLCEQLSCLENFEQQSKAESLYNQNKFLLGSETNENYTCFEEIENQKKLCRKQVIDEKQNFQKKIEQTQQNCIGIVDTYKSEVYELKNKLGKIFEQKSQLRESNDNITQEFYKLQITSESCENNLSETQTKLKELLIKLKQCETRTKGLDIQFIREKIIFGFSKIGSVSNSILRFPLEVAVGEWFIFPDAPIVARKIILPVFRALLAFLILLVYYYVASAIYHTYIIILNKTKKEKLYVMREKKQKLEVVEQNAQKLEVVEQNDQKLEVVEQNDQELDVVEQNDQKKKFFNWLIPRGGFVNSSNIHTLSPFEQELFLTSLSPTLNYIRLEKQRLKLEELLNDSNSKKIKKSFKKSFNKIQNFIYSAEVRNTTVGLIIFVWLILCGNTSFLSNRHDNNNNLFLSDQKLILREINLLEEIENSSLINDPLQEDSKIQTKSSDQKIVQKQRKVRQKAKMVTLKDLPKLTKEFETEEIVPVKSRIPIKLKIK